MEQSARAVDAVLGALGNPAVRHLISWGALVAVAADLGLALLSRRFGTMSVIGALAARGSGWPWAIGVGLVHPAIMLGASSVLTLAATRSALVLDHWWLSGLLAGLVLATGALWFAPAPRRVRSALPIFAVGIVLAAVLRLLASG